MSSIINVHDSFPSYLISLSTKRQAKMREVTWELPNELLVVINSYCQYDKSIFEIIRVITDKVYPLTGKSLCEIYQSQSTNMNMHLFNHDHSLMKGRIVDIVNTEEFLEDPEAFLLQMGETSGYLKWSLSEFLAPFFIFTAIYRKDQLYIECNIETLKQLGSLLLKINSLRNIKDLSEVLIDRYVQFDGMNFADTRAMLSKTRTVLVSQITDAIWPKIEEAGFAVPEENPDGVGFFNPNKWLL